MLEEFTGDKFEYKKLTPEEMESRGILGRLTGVIADYKNPTRNGRYYSKELWEKVFQDPLMKEKIKNRLVFGELEHPKDRTDIDPEKIAICLAEEPKLHDGKLYGVFDILNTPNGKILKTLCDYGTVIGVSSRGEGDVEQDWDGHESVNPDTYSCMCWDAVLIPAVESARLKLVNESLGGKSLKQALNEELQKANPEDRKLMKETIDNLKLGYEPAKVNNIKENARVVKSTNNSAATDIGAHMVNELQEALLSKQKAENLVLELQEKLSVSYAKEAKYEEDIANYKATIRNLNESVSENNKMKQEMSSLREDLNSKGNLIEEQKGRISKYLERQEMRVKRESELKESLNNSEMNLREKEKELRELNENYNTFKYDALKRENTLKENLANKERDLSIKTSEYNAKIANANKIIEKYRNTAKQAVNKYIESKSVLLGVSAQEIKNKLPSNYSFEDIDVICEGLNQYKVNLSKLPISLNENVRMGVREQKETILTKNQIASLDKDDVDDSLLMMAKLK